MRRHNEFRKGDKVRVVEGGWAGTRGEVCSDFGLFGLGIQGYNVTVTTPGVPRCFVAPLWACNLIEESDL